MGPAAAAVCLHGLAASPSWPARPLIVLARPLVLPEGPVHPCYGPWNAGLSSPIPSDVAATVDNKTRLKVIKGNIVQHSSLGLSLPLSYLPAYLHHSLPAISRRRCSPVSSSCRQRPLPSNSSTTRLESPITDAIRLRASSHASLLRHLTALLCESPTLAVVTAFLTSSVDVGRPTEHSVPLRHTPQHSPAHRRRRKQPGAVSSSSHTDAYKFHSCTPYPVGCPP